MKTANRTERKVRRSARLPGRVLMLTSVTMVALAASGCDPSGDLVLQGAEQLATFIQDFIRQWLAALLF